MSVSAILIETDIARCVYGCLVTNMRRAFTLVEILVVVAIIMVIAGIAYPVISSSRKSAHRAACISNLRQCATALVIYSNDHGGLEGLPPYDEAVQSLRYAPTCDLEDYLRPNCQSEYGRPLIGSYAYVRGLKDCVTEKGWLDWITDDPDPFILAAIYYGDQRVKPHVGGDRDPCISNGECDLPSRLIRAKIDTSVSVQSLPRSTGAPGGGTYTVLFTWDPIFTVKL